MSKWVSDMWQFVKDIPGAYKTGAAIVGGIVTGSAAIWGFMLGPVKTNAEAIEVNMESIDRIEHCMDTIRADMTMVQCWARHEILGTDATECLFLEVGGSE